MTFGRISYRAVEQPGRSGLALALLLGLPCFAFGQAPTHGSDPTYSSPSIGTTSSEGMPGGPFGAPSPAEQARMERAHRADIQRTVESDTGKLVKLAQELDDEISRTTPNALTPAQLKKVAEIEKLAHKVQAKMTEFERGGGLSQPLPIPVNPQHQ